MAITPQVRTRLKAFYQNLEDKALEPTDAFYVPLYHEQDPIQEMATRIDWSKSSSVHLLSGQRGSGKSTELKRLRRLLEGLECDVFLIDMRDYMNMTKPVEITDFLVSIMAALTDTLNEVDQKVLKDLFKTNILEFITSRMKLDKVDVAVGTSFKVGIGASLKEDPSFKDLLQKQLRFHMAQLVNQAHEFAASVVGAIRARLGPERKVVLLVDSVEQLRAEGAEDASLIYKSVEELFSGHADALQLPLLHVVYTVPPYLVPLAPSLGRVLGGGSIFSLASIKVRSREGSPLPHGLSLLEQIMERREREWRDVFAPEQLHRMALSTGGDLRDFFRLTQGCIVKAGMNPRGTLPVPPAILEDAENHLRRDMLPLAEADKKWLKRITETKRPGLEEIQHLPQLARFLDTHLVLNYRNGEDWYDVHPLLWGEVKGGAVG